VNAPFKLDGAALAGLDDPALAAAVVADRHDHGHGGDACTAARRLAAVIAAAGRSQELR
jgi:hypothetical protein